jgi:uncharacterized RDD family membrane protein YckC
MYCPKCGAQSDDDAAVCNKCGQAMRNVSLPESTVTSTDAAAVQYAGFWRRLAAALIDGIVLVLACGMLGFVIGGIAYGIVAAGGEEDMPDAVANAITYAAWAATAVLTWPYYALMESSAEQATFGKLILGIRVTDGQGQRISFAGASRRYFGRWLSSLVLCIGFIMVAFTKKKQGLHDIMAGCLVVVKK